MDNPKQSTVGMGKKHSVWRCAGQRDACDVGQLAELGVIQRRTDVDKQPLVVGCQLDAASAYLVGTAMNDGSE